MSKINRSRFCDLYDPHPQQQPHQPLSRPRHHHRRQLATLRDGNEDVADRRSRRAECADEIFSKNSSLNLKKKSIMSSIRSDRLRAGDDSRRKQGSQTCCQPTDPRKFNQLFTGKVPRDIKFCEFKVTGNLTHDDLDVMCSRMCRSPLAKRQSRCRSNTRGTQSRYRESSAQTRPYLPEISNKKGTYEHLEIYKVSKILQPSADPGVPDVATIERARKRWLAIKENLKHLTKSPDKIIIEAFEWEDWIAREENILATQMVRLGIVKSRFEEREKEMRTESQKRIALATKRIGEKNQQEIDKLMAKFGRKMRIMERDYKKVSLRWRKENVVTSVADPSSDMRAPQMRYGINGNRRNFMGYRRDFNQRMDELEKKIRNEPIPLVCPLEKHSPLAKPIQRGHEISTGFCKESNLAKVHDQLTKLRLTSIMQKTIKCLRLKAKPETTESLEDEVELGFNEENYEEEDDPSECERGEVDQCQEFEEYRKLLSCEERKQVFQARQNRRIDELRKCADKGIEDVLKTVEGEIIGWMIGFLGGESKRVRELNKLRGITEIAHKQRQMRSAIELALRQQENRIREENEKLFSQVIQSRTQSLNEIVQKTSTKGRNNYAETRATNKLNIMAKHIDHQVRRWVESPDGMRFGTTAEMVADWIKKLVFADVPKCAPDRDISCVFKEIPFSSIHKSVEAYEIVDGFLEYFIDTAILHQTLNFPQIIQWLKMQVVPAVQSYLGDRASRAVFYTINRVLEVVYEHVGISDTNQERAKLFQALSPVIESDLSYERSLLRLRRTSRLGKTVKLTRMHVRTSLGRDRESLLKLHIELDNDPDHSRKKLKRLSRFKPEAEANKAGFLTPTTQSIESDVSSTIRTSSDVSQAISYFYKRVSFVDDKGTRKESTPTETINEEEQSDGDDVGIALRPEPSFFDLFDSTKNRLRQQSSLETVPEVLRTEASYERASIISSVFDPVELHLTPGQFNILQNDSNSTNSTNRKDDALDDDGDQ